MKILYHHRIRSKDGQFVHVEELVHALRALGHEVIIVAPTASEKTEFGDEGGAVMWLKRFLPHFIYELMELSYSLIVYRRLVRAVEEHHPDCLYERYNLYQPAGVWIKRRYRLPMLLEVNAPIFSEREKYDGLSLKRLARWSERYTWNNADVVLPVTKILGDMVHKEGVPWERIVVVPNGINIERFGKKPEATVAKKQLNLEGHFILGFTGFVRDWHGLDKVIDFLAHDNSASQCHLLVVGDGPARYELETQAKHLGVTDRVFFTGVVDRDQVAQYIAAFDIALQPAVVGYASPLKLFEYLALGRAIVAPDQPNIREVLQDSENALLFDPKSESGLVQAIKRLIENEVLRRHVSCNAANTIAKKQLTWNNNARRVTALAEGIIAVSRDD